MRSFVFAFFVVLAQACSCGGCAEKAAAPPVPDAAVVAVAAPLVPATPDAAVEAEAEAIDGGELPWEVKEGSPPSAKIVATYLADCHADIEVTYDDMEGPQTKVDCTALAFDQNCAPDTFGCFEAVEGCRAGCADPCNACQSKCGDVCDGCKSACDGGDCLRACAEARAACRTTCLYAVQRCRADDCNALYSKCEADGAARTKKLCPDCEAMRTCMEARFEDGKPPDTCLTPGNAKECLEWCSPLP